MKTRYKSRYNRATKKCESNVETKDLEMPAVLKGANRRLKYCMLMGYSGTNYYGMQLNEGYRTIESELLSAMLKCGWITEKDERKPQNFNFQRASRTDRGVSAARQCCSMVLRKTPPFVHKFPLTSVSLQQRLQLMNLRRSTVDYRKTFEYSDSNE